MFKSEKLDVLYYRAVRFKDVVLDTPRRIRRIISWIPVLWDEVPWDYNMYPKAIEHIAKYQRDSCFSEHDDKELFDITDKIAIMAHELTDDAEDEFLMSQEDVGFDFVKDVESGHFKIVSQKPEISERNRIRTRERGIKVDEIKKEMFALLGEKLFHLWY